jgi:predicted transcriptional regulator
MKLVGADLDKDELRGIVYVIVVPILFIGAAIWYLLINQILMILILLVLILIYVALASDEVDYGAEQIRKVQIPNAPSNVQKLLKTTSIRGELVFVFLLSAFNGEERLSQTDLVGRVKQRFKVTLTHQAIRRYIMKLEDLDIIHSPKPSREYEYTLTEQGKWCSEAVKVCFPRTNFSYMKRHFLKVRKLPRYPSVGSHGVSGLSETEDAAKSSMRT